MMFLDIGRMTYVQKVFGDFGFGKGGGGKKYEEIFLLPFIAVNDIICEYKIFFSVLL